MDVFVNNVFDEKYEEEGTPKVVRYRVLFADRRADLVVVFKLRTPYRMPDVLTYTEVQSLLSDAKWVKSEDPLPEGRKAHKRLPEVDPDAPHKVAQRQAELREKCVEIRDNRWKLIRPLVVGDDPTAVFDPTRRGKLISDAAKAGKTSRERIRSHLYEYWADGMVPSALLPRFAECGTSGRRVPGKNKLGRRRDRNKTKHCDTPLGVNWSPAYDNPARTAWRSEYCGKDTTTTKAYQAFLDLLTPDEKSTGVPTYDQYRYRIPFLVDMTSSKKAKAGIRIWNKDMRGLAGRSDHGLYGPGSRYQIDSTIADVYLVSRYCKDWIIGRPVVYVVMDVYSGMVVGLHVGLEGPSWTGARHALQVAFTSKVDFCAQYGVTITEEEWPCAVVCQTLMADRAEILSNCGESLANDLGVHIEFAAACRPDWKGLVEEMFGHFNIQTIKWTPGAVRDRSKEKCTGDYRLHAKLNLDQFTRCLIATVLERNLTRRRHPSKHFHLPGAALAADDVDYSPLEIWRWGLENATGSPRERPPVLIYSALLPKAIASVTESGIYFNGVYYTCETAEKEHWFDRARERRFKRSIRYDPTTMRHIWYDAGVPGKLEICYPRDPRALYAEYRFEEVLDALKYDGMKDEDAAERTQTQADAYRNIKRETLDEAQKKLPAPSAEVSKRQKIKSIKSNRKLELMAERTRAAAKTALMFENVGTAKPKANPRVHASDEDVTLLAEIWEDD